MAKIDKLSDRIIVTVAPDELLHLQIRPGSKDYYEAIKATVWRFLATFAPKVIAGRNFPYGDVSVLDGKFVVAFFEKSVDFNKVPGGP
jgi:hypothetical protein